MNTYDKWNEPEVKSGCLLLSEEYGNYKIFNMNGELFAEKLSIGTHNGAHRETPIGKIYTFRNVTFSKNLWKLQRNKLKISDILGE